ncbi:ATP-binding protein [Thermofilum pendens]|nr:DUF87 domain-containing protein [Thermofilum pendens]
MLLAERGLRVRLGALSAVSLKQGHIVVAGPTGSGKTNTVKVLLCGLKRRGIPFLVLDFHGEYGEFGRLEPGKDLSFNVLSTGDIEFVVDVFSTIFQITEPQWYFLVKALKKGSPPFRLSDIIALVDEEPVRDWREFEIKAAILRRLTILNEGVLGRTLNGDAPPEALFRGAFAVDLSVLPLKYRGLLALVLLKHLYDAAMARGKSQEIAHVTVIEEAWQVLPYRARWEAPSLAERLFLELRKFGEVVVAVAQRLDDLSERVLRNASLVVLHDASRADLQKLGCEDVERIPKLGRGHALVVSEGCLARRVRVKLYRGCS